MQIFRFEWKRSQKYILIWAVALALCIFSMTPVYYGMVETAGTLPTGFAQGGFFETVGISLELLTKPMGMYSFLTGFFICLLYTSVKAKISDQQARLKELEQKHKEAENEEIVDIVRGMSISLEELPLVLQRIKAGDALGQNVPKSAGPEKEDAE